MAGRPRSEDEMVTLAVYMPMWMLNEIKAIAKAESREASPLGRILFSEALAARKAKAPLAYKAKVAP